MTRRVVVKVCGITEERDAHEAVHLGVDALGFDFRKDSPRAIDAALAREITLRIPAFVTTVGVFADEPLIRVLDIARTSGVSMIQFHGSETPGACAAAAPFRWIKAFRVDPSFDPDVLAPYPSTTYLLDARRLGRPATEATFEWRRARTWSTYGRMILAGDFELAHIGMVIEDARPYALDVLSEIEVAPGKKDLDRLELLLDAVRRAERRIAGESA